MTVSRRVLVTAAKVLVSVALLALLVSRQPLAEIRAVLAHPDWTWLLAALALYGLSAVAGAVPWIWLLEAAGSPARAGRLQRLYLIGLFFNNFLPANVGGDAYKVVDLGRAERNPHRAFAATFLDRLLGLAALTLVALGAAAVAGAGGIPLPRVAWLLGAVLAALLGMTAILLSRRAGRWLARIPVRAVGTTVAEFTVWRLRPSLVARALAVGVLVQALRVATHVVVARALHLDLSLAQTVQFFVLVPLLAIGLSLPITINGIGLRETLAAVLLPWTGLPPEAVVAVELAAFLVQVAFSLVGGILFWVDRGRRELPARTGVDDAMPS